jgi:hypothetical protein
MEKEEEKEEKEKEIPPVGIYVCENIGFDTGGTKDGKKEESGH